MKDKGRRWQIIIESSLEPVRARLRLEAGLRCLSKVFGLNVVDVELVSSSPASVAGQPENDVELVKSRSSSVEPLPANDVDAPRTIR